MQEGVTHLDEARLLLLLLRYDKQAFTVAGRTRAQEEAHVHHLEALLRSGRTDRVDPDRPRRLASRGTAGPSCSPRPRSHLREIGRALRA